MQHRAVFGDVDFVAAEHGVDALLEATFASELQQQLQRFVGDAVLGVVEIEPGRLDGQPLAAGRIVGKELPQVDVFEFLIVLLRATPRRVGCAEVACLPAVR